MYEPQRSRSLPFLLRKLPNKNQIREINGKIIGAVILDPWMKKDQYSGILLAAMLRNSNITVPEVQELSSSTIDVRTNPMRFQETNDAVRTKKCQLNIFGASNAKQTRRTVEYCSLINKSRCYAAEQDLHDSFDIRLHRSEISTIGSPADVEEFYSLSLTNNAR